MNSIDPTNITGVNAAAASAKVTSSKETNPPPKTSKDKVSISPEGRDISPKHHENAVIRERIEVLPEVRESILSQARERLMEGYYFSNDVTDALADKLISGAGPA